MDTDFFGLDDHSITLASSSSSLSAEPLLGDDDAELADLLHIEAPPGAGGEDPLLALSAAPSWTATPEPELKSDLLLDAMNTPHPSHSLPPTALLLPPEAVLGVAPLQDSVASHTLATEHLLRFRGGVRPPAKCSAAGFQHPIPREGRLLLTDEERRTLLAEGHRLPDQLPLSPQEEQILKRVRRKIKNKISAQDSRRRRKEYMDALEDNLQLSNRLCAELQTRVRRLEEANLRLTLQLHRCNARRPTLSTCSTRSQSALGGTCLKVLVLCCAVFLVTDHQPSPPGLAPSSSSPHFPILPWVRTSFEVSAWRWSPVRHLSTRQPIGDESADSSPLQERSGPELILSFVQDDRARLLDTTEFEGKDFGPKHLFISNRYVLSDEHGRLSNRSVRGNQTQMNIKRQGAGNLSGTVKFSHVEFPTLGCHHGTTEDPLTYC